MQVTEVKSKKDRSIFLGVAREIYKDDDVWVCPPDKDINSIFDANSNVFFNHGEACRWVIRNENKKLIGRIAAFINYNKIGSDDQPTGGFGFFECINNEATAFKLFDTAKAWLVCKGMEAMDGPINFGEPDKYWGLLVDGFTHPSYEVAYNHKYYQQLYENYGFKTYYKQEGFHLDLTKPIDERFLKIASWVAKKPEYEFRHFTWKDQDKYVNDFCSVYNEAWESFKEDFKPMKPDYIKKTLKKAKAIIEEEFVWLAYNNGKPIAIYLGCSL